MEELLKQEQVPQVEQNSVSTHTTQPEMPSVEASQATLTEAATPKESETQRNFKAIRDASIKAARERDEALRRVEEYERAMAAKQIPGASEVPDEDFSIPDSDDLVDNKKLAEYIRYQKKQNQELKKQYKSIVEQTKSYTGEQRFMAENPDWQKVMTLDNIQALSAAYPELSRSINSATDVYEKAKSTYTLIKRFGIYEEEPYSAEKERALSNAAKPKPLASISPQQGDTPLSRANAFANGLTDDLKQQLRKEMAAASRKY